MLIRVSYKYMIKKGLGSVGIVNNDKYMQRINYIKVLLTLYFNYHSILHEGSNSYRMKKWQMDSK